MQDILLKNGSIFLSNKIIKKDILIIGNKIAKIESVINVDEKNTLIMDCQNKIISPSFIDGHVHTRTPGLEYKEDIKHFSNACIHAGILDVVAMGNVIPAPDNIQNYKTVTKHLQNNFVNIHQVATITKNIAGEELSDVKELSKLTHLFSDDGSPIWNTEIMKKITQLASEFNLMILLHEETRNEDNINEVAYKSNFTKINNWVGLDHTYESDIVLRDLKLLVNKKSHLHFQHLSTKQALDYIIEYQKKGMNITSEITPHHLIFSNEDIKEDDAMLKMNPPLGDPEWKNALIDGLNNGVFSAIVTDHAPHAFSEKNLGFKKSAFGIIGVDTMFPSLYTNLVMTKKVKLETILEHLTSKPAELFLRKKDHFIKVGANANLIIIDLNLEKVVTEEVIFSKAKNTPFLYKKLKGWVIHTIKDGEILF